MKKGGIEDKKKEREREKGGVGRGAMGHWL